MVVVVVVEEEEVGINRDRWSEVNLQREGRERLKIGHLREGEGRPSAMKTKERERDSEALITGGL